MSRLLLAAGFSVAIAGLSRISISGQQVQSPPAERATPYLPVSFAVVTSGGMPIQDLKMEEVSVRIDGRTRDVRSLQLVALGGSGRSAAAAAPPPFGSNGVTSRGRDIHLIVDDESFAAGGEQALRGAAERLLTGAGPSDRISLIAIPRGGVNIPPTTDRTRIRSALATLAGRGDSRQTGSELACRTRETLFALSRRLRTLRAPDAPTVVVLLTSGLAPPRRDAPSTMAPGMCELRLDAFREAGDAAGVARAQFYIVPPVDIMSTGSVLRENIAGVGATGGDNPVEGIEQLLGVTGGKLLNVGAGERSAFDRILDESAAYYVASVDLQKSDGGRTHPLEVRVSRGGAEVRASRAIAYEPPDARSAKGASPSTRDMLSTTAEFRDLPLRAAAFASFEESDGRIRVLTIGEAVEPNVKLSALAAALFDRDGKVAGGWLAQPADLERSPILGATTVPPGAYRLRVAAIDASGRAGAADYGIDVDLARTGTLKISSIILGLSREGGFVPRLQFVNEPVAIGYVEMAGAAPGAKVSAVLELADAPNAAARLSVPLGIEAGASGRYVGRAALPIGALPPGDYTVRAVVALDDHPPTRVIRTLRKVVPAK
ncbi:MAG TPA: hypothetical protein VFK57_06140 [Vicinamibacterales bacterium]|nr:hypothetical protein [Vicinamibacterales bacterium]